MTSKTGEATHEVRHLKHLLKLAHAQVGKQGETIHDLRAELAKVRSEHSKIDRGVLRQQERSIEHLLRMQASDESTIASLRSQVSSYKEIESALRAQLAIAKGKGKTPVEATPVQAAPREEAPTPA